MRTQVRRGTLMIAGVLATAGAARAQEMQMPKQEQHHQMEMPPVKPEYPRMGRAQENAKGALVTLEQAQKIAGESNPTLRQAEAEIRAAKARQQQAGLYPNPTVAYTGDEIRGGSVGGGKRGFFVQSIVPDCTATRAVAGDGGRFKPKGRYPRAIWTLAFRATVGNDWDGPAGFACAPANGPRGTEAPRDLARTALRQVAHPVW